LLVIVLFLWVSSCRDRLCFRPERSSRRFIGDQESARICRLALFPGEQAEAAQRATAKSALPGGMIPDMLVAAEERVAFVASLNYDVLRGNTVSP
jgi:hypothetical protein